MNNKITIWFVAFGLVLAISSCLFAPNAQTQESQWSQDAYTLAVVCTNEISFEPNTDCVGIYETLMYRAEHVYHTSFIRAARIYSTRVFDRTRSSRLWVAHLRPTMDEPLGWPSGLRWSDYSPLWRRRLDDAQRIVNGQYETRCDNTPQHWGSAQDIRKNGWDRRIRRGEWAYANCGDTLNKFIYPVQR